MKNRGTKFLLVLLLALSKCWGQDTNGIRPADEGLLMNFPGIYFKHNSPEYAAMPYTVDSCFDYMKRHAKDIRELVIWRDKEETEELTRERIKRLKEDMKKYALSWKVVICSMQDAQKISRHTINRSISATQLQYLLSLNSVFEISETHLPEELKRKNHIERPRLWCWSCWKNGFHIAARHKLHKAQRSKKRTNKPK